MKLLVALLALAAAAPALAAEPEYPAFQGHPVMDAANIIPDDVEQAIDDKLATYSHDTGRQVLVVTVPDLGDTSIEDYALGIGRKLGIGERDVNDGVVMVIAPKEHHARIEVGPGLQPYLTDATSSIIINEDMIPHFKQGDWAGGVQAGVDDVVRETSPDAITRKQEQAKADEAAHQRFMASLDTFLSWVGMTIAGALGGAGIWWVATAKKRRLRREELARQEAEADAARRERNRVAAEAADRARQQAAERQAQMVRERAEMLARETPSQRQARETREATEAAAAASAAAERRRKEKEREVAAAKSRSSSSSSTSSSSGGYSYGSGYDSTPTPTPTPTPDFSGGGGTFDGGGATGSW